MKDIEELQGLESACRLCLTTEETRSSIFGAAYNVEPLIEKIENCLSLQISQDDKLSTLICITCVNKVSQWHQYKKECLQSQDKLSAWLAKQSEPLPVVTVKKELEEDSIEHSHLEKITEKNAELDKNNENSLEIIGNTSGNLEIIENGEQEQEMETEIENMEITTNIQGINNENNSEKQINRESTKRRLSKDFGNEAKRFNPLPIKTEPIDDSLNIEENHINTENMENTENTENTENLENSVNLEIKEIKQQKVSSLKGKKKIRRGPHTHFRGARIFKRKCLHCQINLHSKTSYAKHMARFHSISNLENEGEEEEEEEEEEMIEDVEEELENLEEDAPLTPVQQNIISQFKTFTCYSCEESFNDCLTTLNHIRQHMPDLRAFTCVACLTEFGNENAYKKHCEISFECAMKIALVIPIQGTEKYFTCNMCTMAMGNRKELLSHLAKHSDKQYEELMSPPVKLTTSLPYGQGDPAYNHECDLCGMIYRYKSNMIKHRELCASLQPEGRTSYKCIDCGMTFLVFNKFHSHVMIEHKKKELKCPKCAAKFRSPGDYLTHHEFHRKKFFEEKKFSCNLCNGIFATRGELTEHRNLHLKVKIYSCAICRSMFSSAGALEIHMKDHGIDDPSERTANTSCLEYGNKTKNTECHECGKIFSNVANLKRHIRNAHGENEKLICDCKRIFKNKESYDEHQRVAHNLEKTVLTCLECPKTFVFQANLDLHINNHHAKVKVPHECEICGKTFAEESSLKIHRGWHNRANSRFSLDNQNTMTKPAKARKSFPMINPMIQLQCQVCDDKFNDVGDLRKHVWDVHCARTAKTEPSSSSLQEEEKFHCEICDKYYSSGKILARHKKLHKQMNMQKFTIGKKIICHPCGRTFTAESALKRHRAISPECLFKRNETMKKPVTCHICKTIFPNMSILYQHKQLIHKTQENDSKNLESKCNICSKQFTNISNLKQHISMKHKNTMEHPCTVINCNMIFSTLHALKSHELQHSNMIYSCTLCEKHFFHRGIMEKHIYNSHRIVYKSIGDDKDSLFKETDLTSYNVRGATGTVCPRCKIKYPNIKAMKIHYFKFHETQP